MEAQYRRDVKRLVHARSIAPDYLLTYKAFGFKITQFAKFHDILKGRAMIPTIEWKDGKVCMLDQTKLPTEIVYTDCLDYKTVARGIKELWIRGAPAIGIAAAMGVALAANDIRARDFETFYKKLETACDHLGETQGRAHIIDKGKAGRGG